MHWVLSLSKKYYRTLFHYATRFVKDTALVEDCIQDVWLKLWNRREHLGETSSVKFYLLKSLRNHLFRVQQKNPQWEKFSEWHEPALDEENAESQMIRQESFQQLQQLLGGLPSRQREALYLRYYEGLTNEQVAQLMGIHAQSVANLLQLSLKKMRILWMDYLVCCFISSSVSALLLPIKNFFPNA
jgi:RNA polymerase sigma factor (sigma-70 family)